MSFTFTATVTICSALGAQENKVCHYSKRACSSQQLKSELTILGPQETYLEYQWIINM